MRILHDRERCVGSGSCVFAEPSVFDQDEEDGRVVVLEERPDESRRAAIMDAITMCPVQAIELTDN